MPKKLRVQVVDDEIIVTRPGSSYMTLSEFLAQAWRLAKDKERELGWIV